LALTAAPQHLSRGEPTPPRLTMKRTMPAVQLDRVQVRKQRVVGYISLYLLLRTEGPQRTGMRCCWHTSPQAGVGGRVHGTCTKADSLPQPSINSHTPS
jgi:hypothetical protein